MITQQINITVKTRGLPPTIDVVQGDSGRTLECHVVDMTIPSGATARIYAKKPSGAEVYNTCTVSGDVVTVDVTAQMIAEAGKTPAQVEIIQGDERVTSFDLLFCVAESRVNESAIESKDELTVLEELTSAAQGAADDANAAADAANTAAENANAAATSATTAASAANPAAENANSAAAEIQQKVENGDFTASVSIGTVTTGEPGTNASVVNSGTEQDAILDFTIPKGEVGSIEAGGIMSIENGGTGAATAEAARINIGACSVDDIYPVGAVLASVNPDYDPNEIFETHTWERFAKGQTLVGVDESDTDFSAAGKTGGEKTHTLTEAEMPSHAHTLSYASYQRGSGDLPASVLEYSGSTKSTGTTGGGSAHNNLQPYTTVYYWMRTA